MNRRVDLFAFQDVLAALLGLVFLLVLLLAIQPAAQAPSPTAAATAAEARALRERLDAASVERARRDTERALAPSPDDLRAEVARLERAAQRTTWDAHALEQDVIDRAAELAPLETRLADLHAELAAERQRAADAEPDPDRVTYVLGAPLDSLEPWLVHVTADHLRVGTHDGAVIALDSRAPRLTARLDAFSAWLSGLRPRDHYLVVLITPDAVDAAATVLDRARQANFRVGTDLIPAAWKPFP